MVFHSREFKLQSHRDLDGDSRADVSPWENGVRTVHYSVGVELPSAIRTLIGRSSSFFLLAGSFLTTGSLVVPHTLQHQVGFHAVPARHLGKHILH